MWEIVEDRKEQNVLERKKVIDSGTVESALEFLTICGQQLMQSELDKFKISVQIIHDYYFSIEEKTNFEIQGATTTEIPFDGDEMPQVESIGEGADANKIESYNYPKLEKLLQNALKQQIVPDITQI
jgi:hypothetical protein